MFVKNVLLISSKGMFVCGMVSKKRTNCCRENYLSVHYWLFINELLLSIFKCLQNKCWLTFDRQVRVYMGVFKKKRNTCCGGKILKHAQLAIRKLTAINSFRSVYNEWYLIFSLDSSLNKHNCYISPWVWWINDNYHVAGGDYLSMCDWVYVN